MGGMMVKYDELISRLGSLNIFLKALYADYRVATDAADVITDLRYQLSESERNNETTHAYLKEAQAEIAELRGERSAWIATHNAWVEKHEKQQAEIAKLREALETIVALDKNASPGWAKVMVQTARIALEMSK